MTTVGDEPSDNTDDVPDDVDDITVNTVTDILVGEEVCSCVCVSGSVYHCGLVTSVAAGWDQHNQGWIMVLILTTTIIDDHVWTSSLFKIVILMRVSLNYYKFCEKFH